MKKLIFLIVLIVALSLIVAGCGLLTAPPSDKAKPDSGCATIKDGTIVASTGETLTTGYDVFGYNYQAHIFNGRYCDVDRVLGGAYCDVNLIMKWNDAWMSNKDCDGDGKLDRHYGYDTYRGSGAWLTNHQVFCWSFIGDWVLELNWEGGLYAHDVTFTTEVPCESFSGTGGYPSGGPYSITSTVSGIVDTSVVPNEVLITITYDHNGSQRYLEGTITDGTMSGDWTSNVDPLDPYAHSGTWESTMGTALCYWDYFVKIVAAPTDAVLEGGIWYAADGTEIGPVIWGQFAIIQQVENDPCADIHGVTYLSPAGPGLGKWEY